jgi:hypothetical protein
VTALMAWPSFHRNVETEVDNQVAAPAETGTDRNKTAHQRVRMEGWRQWRSAGCNQLESLKLAPWAQCMVRPSRLRG